MLLGEIKRVRVELLHSYSYFVQQISAADRILYYDDSSSSTSSGIAAGAAACRTAIIRTRTASRVGLKHTVIRKKKLTIMTRSSINTAESTS